MSGGGSPQPAGNTTTVQKSDPWSGQQPFLAGGGAPGTSAGAPGPAGMVNPGSSVPGVLPAAASLYENYAPSFYPGQTVAQLNPLQTSGIGAEYGYGATGGSPAVGAATNYETNLMNGAYLDPTKNPNWQTMAGNVLAQTVPGLESQFTQGNTMNSPGAAYAVSQGANDALGGLAAQQYGNTLGLMSQGIGYQGVPGLQNANLSSIGAMQDAGQQLQSQSQANINADIARYNFGQTLPYNLLGNYASLVNGNYGGTSSLTTPYFTNPTGSALSGALGGAAVGGSLFGVPGAVGGGLLGAVGGLL